MLIADTKFNAGGPTGPKIQARPCFLSEPGLMVPGLCRALGRRSQCIMYWLPVFVRFLNDAGWSRCWAQQISCGAGLDSGWAFGEVWHLVLIINNFRNPSSYNTWQSSPAPPHPVLFPKVTHLHSYPRGVRFPWIPNPMNCSACVIFHIWLSSSQNFGGTILQSH